MLPSSLSLTTVWRTRTRGKRSTSSLVKVLPWRVIFSIETVSLPSMARKPYRFAGAELQENSKSNADRRQHVTAGLTGRKDCERGVVISMDRVYYSLLSYRFFCHGA